MDFIVILCDFFKMFLIVYFLFFCLAADTVSQRMGGDRRREAAETHNKTATLPPGPKSR